MGNLMIVTSRILQYLYSQLIDGGKDVGIKPRARALPSRKFPGTHFC
jgi:hypothetical protein